MSESGSSEPSAERPAAPGLPIAPERAGDARRRHLWLALRIAFPVAMLGYLLSIVSLAELRVALAAVPMSRVLAVVLLFLSGLFLAAVRWKVLLRACGVAAPVHVLQLFRLHWVGNFYNTCVPGGVGGDVIRAVAARRLFGERGVPAALGIAFLERLLGLTGLFLVVTIAFLVRPLPGVSNVMGWVGLGIACAFTCLTGILAAPRLAPHVPGPIRRLLVALPRFESLPLLGVGLFLSLLTQLVGVFVGHLVLSSMTDRVTWSESLVIMPLVSAAQYFPLTIAGTGVREAAFVALYGLVGVARHDSLAASIVVGGLMLVAASGGGLVQMVRPLTLETAEQT